MVGTISQIILIIGILIFSIKLFIKGYKEPKNDFEKILYILLSAAIIFPLIIYYLDKYNIPSKLGYTENIISSDWVGILTNYSAAIISTLISTVFLIYITFTQIDETYKDNIKLNNENQRIQNLPLLKYNFTHERLEGEMIDENKKWILSNRGDSNNNFIDFTIEIENIGLNTARKVYLEMESELFNKKEIFELCNQSSLEKNELKKREIIITNITKGNYKIEITIYYQDLLKNWYRQKINLSISVTNIFDSNTHDKSQINTFVVDDEERLSKQPRFISKK